MAKPRLQIDLSDEAYTRLSEVAAREGSSVSEVIRRALNIEEYLRNAQERGSRVLIAKPNGETQHLLIV